MNSMYALDIFLKKVFLLILPTPANKPITKAIPKEEIVEIKVIDSPGIINLYAAKYSRSPVS